MIAEKNSGLEVTSTIQGDKVAMSIDENAMAHIMSVLTDLYSDPELAVIREYSTNAYDAHIEAGQTRPIEVDLPTPLSPFLKVRDFGVGLTIEDIHEIYSKYGASTKRATNDQVGMLGLGCKSALTYAEQFTLSATKNGKRATVAISRDEEGGGSMTIVDSRPTDDPNGVEVVVPAKRHNAIDQKAREFFRYWPEDAVLVNGKPPERSNGLELSPRLFVENGGSEDRIVMGNVAYPAELDVRLAHNHSLVAFVDIGDVNFTPSREQLHPTTRTKATIERVREDFAKAVKDAIQSAIDKCQTRAEALSTKMKWCEALPGSNDTYTFKGEEMPATIGGEDDDRYVRVPHNSYTLNQHTEMASLRLEEVVGAVWFYNFEAAKFSSEQKKKITQWMAEQGHEAPRYYVLTKDKPACPWIDQGRVFDWQEVKLIKLAPVANKWGVTRIPGSYDMYVNGERKMGEPADNIDTKHPVYFYNGRIGYASHLAKVMADLQPKNTIVCMPANRIEKFQRNFPKAVSLLDGLRAEYDAWLAGISEADKEALAINDRRSSASLTVLNPERVNDPELRRAIRLAKRDLTKLLEQRKVFSHVRGAGVGEASKWKNPLDAYPLFDSYRHRNHAAHSYLYLNAAYAETTKGA